MIGTESEPCPSYLRCAFVTVAFNEQMQKVIIGDLLAATICRATVGLSKIAVAASHGSLSTILVKHY